MLAGKGDTDVGTWKVGIRVLCGGVFGSDSKHTQYNMKTNTKTWNVLFNGSFA